MTVMEITEEQREELENQRRALKRNRRIPYEDLDRAVKIGERAFPDADEVKALIYQNSIYIEVWKSKAALIYFVDVDGEEVLEHRQMPKQNRRRTSRSAG